MSLHGRNMSKKYVMIVVGIIFYLHMIIFVRKGALGMADYYYRLQVETIKAILNKKTYNQYLLEQITLPTFDEDRIGFMVYALCSSNIDEDEQQAYIAATMLAQLALETHDRASDSYITLKERQLAILAGDLFSGLYYNLLSSYQNIPLIKSLATAIKKINEHKIYLYYYNDTTELFFNSMKKVESSLIEKFCVFFDCDNHVVQFIHEFFFLKKIVKELKIVHNGLNSMLIDRLKLILSSQISLQDSKTDINHILIKQSSEYVQKSFSIMKQSEIECSHLPSFIKDHIDELQFELEELFGTTVGEG